MQKRAGPSCVLNELGTLWEKRFLVKLWVDILIYIPCKPHFAGDTANQFVRIGDIATFSSRKILKRAFLNWVGEKHQEKQQYWTFFSFSKSGDLEEQIMPNEFNNCLFTKIHKLKSLSNSTV